MSKGFRKSYALAESERVSAEEMYDANELEMRKELCFSHAPQEISAADVKGADTKIGVAEADEREDAREKYCATEGGKSVSAVAALCAVLSISCLAAALIALAYFVFL